MEVQPHAPERLAVVLNGNAKNVTAEVVDTLEEILDSGDLFVSRSLEEAGSIAETLVDRGYKTVLTGGGDGTFTSVVTRVVRLAEARGVEPPQFGLLRLGTGNSLAWFVGAHGVGRRGLAADLHALRDRAGSRPLRLVEVEGHLAPFCGFGIDANVLADFHRVRDVFRALPLPMRWATGLVSYGLAATTMSMPKYLFKKVPRVRVVNLGATAYAIGQGGKVLDRPVYERGETIFEGPARMASISTIPYYGFGFRVFPFATAREDRMSLRITTIGPTEFVPNVRGLWRGTYQNPNSLWDYLIDRVRVELDVSTAFQIGGDAMGDRRSVEVGITSRPVQIVDLYAPPRH